MSEHEQEVLQRLEQQFRPTSPDRAPAAWPHGDRSTRLVAAAIALPVGLALMVVALMLDAASASVSHWWRTGSSSAVPRS